MVPSAETTVVVYATPLAAIETAVVAVADDAVLFTVNVLSRRLAEPNLDSGMVRLESRRR